MLRIHRQSRRLSQKQMAEEIGITPSQMSKLECGGRPDGDQVLKIGQWMRQDVAAAPADLVQQAEGAPA